MIPSPEGSWWMVVIANDEGIRSTRIWANDKGGVEVQAKQTYPGYVVMSIVEDD